MELDLSGRTVVVTGGTRGIGRAISLGFADAGADVVPLSRTDADVERVAEAVRGRGVESRVETLGSGDRTAVEATFDRIAEDLGVDVVVNNAGINPDDALGTSEAVSDEGYDRVLEVDLGGRSPARVPRSRR